MNTKTTLKSIFAKSKNDLSDSLKGLSLPKDAQQIQQIVTHHLNNLFENENDYRQSLTESEDYILQSVLRLLNAQQNIAKEITKSTANVAEDRKSAEYSNETSPNPYLTMAGAGVGAVAGGLLSSWGAVAGAIAGTALVIYLSAKSSNKLNNKTSVETVEVIPVVNTGIFVSIVENICESIDGVIETFRVQIKRIENTYELREKPSLTKDYAIILEQIANVYNVCSALDNVPTKLKQTIDFMVESLENYDIEIINGKIVNK